VSRYFGCGAIIRPGGDGLVTVLLQIY